MALRRHLIILAALTILPLFVFTTWIVLELHREERARAERALTDTARALSLAVSRGEYEPKRPGLAPPRPP